MTCRDLLLLSVRSDGREPRYCSSGLTLNLRSGTWLGVQAILPWILIIPLILSCSKQEDVGINKFSDPVIRQIYTLKDERKSDELLAFVSHENADYRREAIYAFGSVQDTMAIALIGSNLSDMDPEIRRAAAFALGQMKEKEAMNALITRFESEEQSMVQYELLTAMGKCVGGDHLNFLFNFQTEDSLLLEAKAWAIYNAGLRGIKSNAGTIGLVDLLSREYNGVRLASANYLARIAGPELNIHADKLVAALVRESDWTIKMNLVRALGKTDAPNKRSELIQLINPSEDYRVVVNALRALNEVTPEELKQFLAIEHPQVRVSLSNLIARSTSLSDEEIRGMLDKTTDSRVRGSLYARLLQANPSEEIVNDILEEIKAVESVYGKGELLKSLGSDARQLPVIDEMMFNASNAYVRTSGMSAVLNVLRQTGDGDAVADVIKRAIGSGDIGLISMAAGALANPAFNFKEVYDDYTFLFKARDQLQLPIDAEAYGALQRAIDAFENRGNSGNVENPFNNPMDWEHIQQISKTQEVLIKTTRGEIIFRLDVEEAPGTVDFIVKLIKKGFYNGLTFHRVVPNFVAQGGCPRGDGYGGTPESIRSEFGYTQYTTGSVGMASAGKDTESCQFFITHRPTPHLNGSYTIFGEVIKGMDVVEDLRLGDIMESVQLIAP